MLEKMSWCLKLLKYYLDVIKVQEKKLLLFSGRCFSPTSVQIEIQTRKLIYKLSEHRTRVPTATNKWVYFQAELSEK